MKKLAIYCVLTCVLMIMLTLIYPMISSFFFTSDSHNLMTNNWTYASSSDPHLINYIKHIFHPPSELPYNLREIDKSYQPHGKSWDGIYKFSSSLFKDKKSGFFIEAGALDGQFLSNTLWLEKDNDWNGILVEPHPSSFNELLKKNRKCWKLQSCLSTKTHPEFLTFFSYKEADHTKNSYSWAMRGQTQLKKDSRKKHLTNDFTLQCFPLESMLLALNVSTVDFFSLDVEVTELNILKTINFEKFNIRSLLVESNHNSKNVIEFVKSQGYLHVRRFNNDNYFIRNSDFELINLFKTESTI